jgi:uncharacterized Ntn-hydrolase superfamily protein
MTFSVVARSDDGESWGVAVASKFLAVGAIVSAARAGVGAVATQAHPNLAYKPRGLAAMAEGRSAEETLALLVESDDHRADRQVGLVDREGRAASYTGEACLSWAGSTTGPGFAAQGNILAGPRVLEALVAAWHEHAGEADLARRLVAALTAGDRAGGDRRGAGGGKDEARGGGGGRDADAGAGRCEGGATAGGWRERPAPWWTRGSWECPAHTSDADHAGRRLDVAHGVR